MPNRFPDFGKELRRDFDVHKSCYDCSELYHGCNARPENPSSRCADYFPLPDVGVNGKTGQEIPPSRMGDRKEPRIRSTAGAPVRVQPENPPSRRPSPAKPEPVEQDPPVQPRQQSPAGNPGADGKRLCGCGAVLPKRRRCCEACRRQRREATIRRHRKREQPSAAVYDLSGVPFAGPGTPST